MYSVMGTHELHTARVENGGQVQFPVGQSTGRAATGSEAANMPLYTAAFIGRIGTKLSLAGLARGLLAVEATGSVSYWIDCYPREGSQYSWWQI